MDYAKMDKLMAEETTAEAMQFVEDGHCARRPSPGAVVDGMLVNTLAPDYVTLTAKQPASLRAAAFRLFDRLGVAAKTGATRVGYVGLSFGGLYYGEKINSSGRCDILQVPGLLSNRLFKDDGVYQYGVNCTRFDLQATVPIEDCVEPEYLYNLLCDTERYPWQARGVKPQIAIIKNSDGGQTLSIGRRTSDVYRRMYVKEVQGRKYVRFEVEIKGRLAKRLFERGDIYEPGAAATLYRALLAQLPSGTQQHLIPFEQSASAPTGEYVPVDRKSTDDETVAWFASTVAPALRKASAGKLRKEVLGVLEANGIIISVK